MPCSNFERELDAFLDGAGIKYFSAREIAPVGKRTWTWRGTATLQEPPRDIWAHILPTLEVLDWLREQVGPLHVNSGYRDPVYNRIVGGAKDSRHVAFNAIDFYSTTHKPHELAALLEQYQYASALGIGRYETFVHVDTRGVFGLTAPARWIG